jgi:ACS family allantoate permease-like MFS transporter
MSDEKAISMDVEPQRSLDQKLGKSEHIDRGASFLAEAQEYAPLSPEAERRLMRKVDWIMIPMLFITATFGAVDKVALGTAAIYGLQTDAHLHGQQYSWLGSILSLGVCIVRSFPDVQDD